MATYWFRRAWENMLGGSGAAEARESDYLSDTMKVSLHSSSYAYDLATHEVYTDLTNEVSGTGYSSGGATVGSKTITTTAANSWSPTWATGTAYTAGDVIRPTSGNGRLYVAITSGTSHASTEPTWTTTFYDEQPADNTVTWCCIGASICVIDAADPSWGPGATISGIRYAVLYNDSATDKPLFWLHDFGSDQAVTNGTFTITLPTTGFHHLFNQ
jgi:hypothetical protein